MSVLIEGLPDAVTLRCLAHVPFYLHPKLELVNHSWRAALRSPELFKARIEVGSTEEFLCVCAFEPENLWQLYDPQNDIWMTIPVLPSKIRHLAHFGAVSARGKLYVLGGRSEARGKLYVLEGRMNEMVASASEVRRRIRSGVIGLGGDLYVVGGVLDPVGFNLDIKPSSDVDALTVESERPTWRRVAPMSRCRGDILGCAKLRF